METLIELSWRVYPISALIALGIGLALWGLLMVLNGLRGALRGDSGKLLPWIQGFRLTIIGLALAGLGVAWAWHLTWLLVLTLAIGGEETLESSIVIFALRRGRRLEMQKLSRPATLFSHNQSIKKLSQNRTRKVDHPSTSSGRTGGKNLLRSW